METEQLKQIKKECLRLLARREHSRKEIEQKLIAKGYIRSQILAVIEELTYKNWQDDTRYAESYTRQRTRNGFGPLRITYELQQQGIDPLTIAQIVQPEAEHWRVLLQQVYLKKYSTLDVVALNERAKRIRFLTQRGFSNASINTLFKQND